MNAKPMRQEHEAAIRQVVQDMQDGQNTKNGELFASAFAQVHDYVAIHGVFLPNQTRKTTPASTKSFTTAAEALWPEGTGRWRFG